MNILGKENQSSTLNVMARTRSSIWKKHTIMALQVSLLIFCSRNNDWIRISKFFSDGPGHYSEYLQSIGENPCICIPGFHRHPDGRCIWFHDNHYCQTVHAESASACPIENVCRCEPGLTRYTGKFISNSSSKKQLFLYFFVSCKVIGLEFEWKVKVMNSSKSCKPLRFFC